MVPAGAARLTFLTLAGLGIAGCAAGPLPGPPPAAAPAVAAPMPATGETRAEEQRDRYIERALTRAPPAGLKGRREVGVGTGFFIAPDKVLTNYHVAGICTALTVGNGIEGKEVEAKLVARSPSDDLAVIETAAPMGKPARFETALYTETGADLAVVGYPAHGLAVLEAELSPISAREQDLTAAHRHYFFHGSVQPGNSGSPVLDDTGAVVGIVSAKVDTVAIYRKTGRIVDNIGVAIANRTVFDFLHRSAVAFLPALPSRGLAPEQLLKKANGFVRQVGCWR